MPMLTIALTLLSLMFTLAYTPSSRAANYEESLKQFTEQVTAGAMKAKKRRVALLDFTDSKGSATPLGQFLAEELGTHLLLAGELAVVERALLHSTLKTLHVDHIDPGHAKASQQAAKTLGADVFISGIYVEGPDSVQITARLINPSNARMIGAARGTLPKIGPLGQFSKKEEPPQPVMQATITQEPPQPIGLGLHRNEYYELVVHTIERQDRRAKMDLTIENRFPRDLKVLCHLQDTVLKDDHGTVWRQEVENNRESLCTRGLELSPRRKQRALLTFTASGETAASRFSLHFHEQSPRRDASFTIEGLRVESTAQPASTTP